MNAIAAPTRHTRWLLRGSLAAVAALMASVNLEAQQRRWIFQPEGPRTDQAGVQLTGLRDQWVEFSSEATGTPVRLHGLWLAQPQADAPVMLYLHGAGWDLSGSLQRMQHLHALGFAVLGIDYRGFGRSTGGPAVRMHGLRGRARGLAVAGAAPSAGTPVRVRPLARWRHRSAPGGASRRRCRRGAGGHVHVDPRSVRHPALGLAAAGAA